MAISVFWCQFINALISLLNVPCATEHVLIGARQEPTPPLHQQQQQQQQRHKPSFIPLSREREVSRARARRAQADGWAVPREVVSLSPSPMPPPRSTVPGSANGDGVRGTEGGGTARVVAATAGFSCTVFMTDDGRMFLCGEGAAVAGGDLTTLEEKVEGTKLREGGGLVRSSKEKGGIYPLVVSRESGSLFRAVSFPYRVGCLSTNGAESVVPAT